MSDIVLNIHEAKSNLSQYLNSLTGEDRIILCKRNRPIAEIRLLPEAGRKPRRLGLAKGQFTVPGTFFEPLPDDVLDAFEGGP
jgi:antitoxin (DNA-binding transcriptional repressor) of toxin-antitoxin stability system